MSEHQILSIDAWGECHDSEHDETTCDCQAWGWNAWYSAGTYYESEYGDLTEESALQCFADKLGATLDEIKSKCEIYDDQYNLVLIRKDDRCPLYAIEYGNN